MSDATFDSSFGESATHSKSPPSILTDELAKRLASLKTVRQFSYVVTQIHVGHSAIVCSLKCLL
jgi:hypothetical protein